MDVRQTRARRPFRRLGVLGVGAALAGAALTGCAAGQRAQTSSERAVIDGVDAQVGSLVLSDVTVAAPTTGPRYLKGGSAPLQFVLVNEGKSTDALTSVTSDLAQASVVSARPLTTSAAASPQASDGASSSPSSTSPGSVATGGATGDAPTSQASTGGSASGTATTSGGAGDASGDAVSSPVEVPVDGSVRFGQPHSGPQVVLQQLTGPLYPAQPITLHFTFRSGLTVDVTTTVATVDGDSSAPTLAATPSEAQ